MFNLFIFKIFRNPFIPSIMPILFLCLTFPAFADFQEYKDQARFIKRINYDLTYFTYNPKTNTFDQYRLRHNYKDLGPHSLGEFNYRVISGENKLRPAYGQIVVEGTIYSQVDEEGIENLILVSENPMRKEYRIGEIPLDIRPNTTGKFLILDGCLPKLCFDSYDLIGRYEP